MNQSKLSFATNTLFSTFREVIHDGKSYLVVNGVPLMETVLNGRYVSAEELYANDWNDVPVVLRHPKKNGGSAKVPDTDVPVIGRFYNSKIDEKAKRLVGEFWLDKAVLEDMQEGQTLVSMIANRKPIEVSTGYWSETLPQTGQFNGVNYGYVDRGIRPDHIALLPDEVGACSVRDGCGLNRNQAQMCQNCESSQHLRKNAVDGTYEKRMSDIYTSFEETMRMRDKRASELGSETKIDYGYGIEATADEFIICKKGSELYRVGYTYNESNGKVYFDDESEWVPVVKIERYVERLAHNVTGSLPAEGKKVYEAVYQKYKDDEGLSEAEAAKRAWGAVKKAGWEQDKDGKWMKKNQSDDLLFELFGLYSIHQDDERSKA